MKHPFEGLLNKIEDESVSRRRLFFSAAASLPVLALGACGTQGSNSSAKGVPGMPVETNALGEGGDRVTTMAVGEEGGDITTKAVGEEGGDCSLTTAVDECGSCAPSAALVTGIGNLAIMPLAVTTAVGETGGAIEYMFVTNKNTYRIINASIPADFISGCKITFDKAKTYMILAKELPNSSNIELVAVAEVTGQLN